MSDIKTIRPEVPLPTGAFLEHSKARVPEDAPVVIIWMNQDGSAQMLTNNTLRQHIAWLATNMHHFSTHYEKP